MKRLAIVALSLLFALKASAISFNFTFDNDLAPGIQAVVGTGNFTFANDPGNGTFAFNSLGAFSMAFSFTNGVVLSAADILSDLSQVLVVLSTSGSNRRLQFSDTGAGGGGPFLGSLDLANGTGALSFEPSYLGGNLDSYQEAGNSKSANFFGSYLATSAGASVPDGGSSQTLMLLAIVAIIGLHYILPRRSTAWVARS